MFPEWASGLLLPADDLVEAFEELIELFAGAMKPKEAAELRREAAKALKKLDRLFGGKLIEL